MITWVSYKTRTDQTPDCIGVEDSAVERMRPWQRGPGKCNNWELVGFEPIVIGVIERLGHIRLDD